MWTTKECQKYARKYSLIKKQTNKTKTSNNNNKNVFFRRNTEESNDGAEARALTFTELNCEWMAFQ